MEEVKIWEEQVMIPTYEVREADKNPMFLEKRVYQGSSGTVSYTHLDRRVGADFCVPFVDLHLYLLLAGACAAFFSDLQKCSYFCNVVYFHLAILLIIYDHAG